MAKMPEYTLRLDTSGVAAAVKRAIEDGLSIEPETPSADTAPRKRTAFDLVAATPWAIQPQMLETIAQIASRENESPEAVAAKLGRPLQNTRSVTVRDGVAIVPVTGPIMRYANLFTEISGATSLEMLSRDFAAAVADPDIKAIVLEMDSPGGQAVGIAEFAHMVRVGTEQKPVIAYVDGTAASAAYWIASAAGQVVISKTGMVGSIGALFAIDTRPKTGVLEIVSSQSPKKRPDVTTDEGLAQIQKNIDALAQVFIEDVAAYRGVDVGTVLANFGQGDVMMGAEAVRLGMADEVSTLESVIAGFAGELKGGSQLMAIKKHGVAAAIENAAEGDVCQLEDGTEGIVKDGACVPAEPAVEPADEVPAAMAVKLRAEGVKAERARIHALMQTPLANAYGDLLAQAIAEGMEQGVFANAILSAESKARGNTLTALRGEAHKPLPQPAAPDNGVSEINGDPETEDQAKAKWEASEAVRAEFKEFSTYWSFCQLKAKNKHKANARK